MDGVVKVQVSPANIVKVQVVRAIPSNLLEKLSPETASVEVAKAVTARLAAETAQGLSEDARDASIAAQGLAEAAQASAETAQGLSESARDASIAAQGLAETAQGLAEVAAETAVLNANCLFYATKALLDADLAHAAGARARVTNDSTAANNVYYTKSGASGTGSWVADAALYIPDNTVTTPKMVNKSVTVDKVADFAINRYHIANDTVGPEKAEFIVKSTNLLNKADADVVLDYYISGLGVLTAVANYYASHKIYVVPGEQITMRYAESEMGAAYDRSGNFISKIGTVSGGSTPFTFTVPANTYYIRVNGQKNKLATDMVVKGSSYPSSYSEFKLSFSPSLTPVNDDTLTTLKYKDASISARKVGFVDSSANLFDVADTRNVVGAYLYNGSAASATGYAYSHPIDVKGGEVYIIPRFGAVSDTVYGSYLDANGTFVANVVGVSAGGGSYRTLTVPSNQNIASMQINYNPSTAATLMMVKSDTYPESYIPFSRRLSESFGLNSRQIAQTAAGGILYEKTALFDGDSICEGWWVGGAWSTGKSWPYVIGVNNSMTVVNAAVSGGTMAYVAADKHCISRNVASLPETADYVIFEGGINDYWNAVTVGAVSSGYSATLDDTTFCGALENLFKQAQLKWPVAKIGYIIVHKVYDTTPEAFWVKAREICEKWNIPYLDLYKMSGLNYNLETIRNSYSKESSPGVGDGCHLTEAACRAFIAPKVEAWMKTL